MAAALHLDLAPLGQGKLLPAKIRQGFTADMPEPLCQFIGQPAVHSRILPQIELSAGRILRQTGKVHRLRIILHLIVDDMLMQRMMLHPFDDFAIMGLRHQQGYAEAMEQALQGTLPLGLLRLYLHELSGEGNLPLSQIQAFAELLPDADILCGDAGFALPQGIQLRLGGLPGFFQSLAAALRISPGIGDFLLPVGSLCQKIRQRLLILPEILFAFRNGQLQYRGLLLVAVAAAPTLCQCIAVRGELGLQQCQLAAAVLPDGLLRFLQHGLHPFPLGLDSGFFLLRSRLGPLQAIAFPLAQLLVLAGKPGRQRILHMGQLILPVKELEITIAAAHQRTQQFLLLPGPYHRGMGLIQILEMLQKDLHIRFSIRLFQHVLPYKPRQLIHLFHGNGLLEQIHCLLLANAEATAEIPGIGRIIIIEMDVGIAVQPLFQAAHIGTEIAEMVLDGQSLIRQHIETGRPVIFIPEPEYLGQGDPAAQVLIAENRQQHAVLIPLPQGLRLSAAILRTLLGKIAPHIGGQTALLGTGISGLIIGHLFRRDQQGYDCIHQGGFSRTHITGEQRGIPMELQAPDLFIKGAPVINLQPLQAEPHGHILAPVCEIK